MPNDVIRISDAKELVPTRLYPHASFPFANFNTVQSALFRVYEREANACIAAATSAGKTVVAEMMLAHEVRERGGKGMYISPLKALAQEKIDDWTNDKHHFSNLKLSICTGDYVLTPARKKELQDANLILMTSEMLASRTRNHKSEKNNWIKEVGTIVVDECFAETTLVVTDQGMIPIGRIVREKMDVKVLSYNHSIRQVEYRSIAAYQEKLLKKEWVTFYYDGGYVQVTGNQHIWVVDRGYIPAVKVVPGDLVEVVFVENESHCTDDQGEESDIGIASRGWEYSTDWTEQDCCPISMQSFTCAESTCRVEVQRVEATGWNPSEDFTKRWLRSFCASLYDVIDSRVEGDVFSGDREWETACQSAMVGVDRSSFVSGDMVHGRWQSGQECSDIAYRGIQSARGGTTRRMDDKEMELFVPSVSNQELSLFEVHRIWERHFSGLDTSIYYFRDGVQVDDAELVRQLHILWGIFSDTKSGKIKFQELPLLWLERLQEAAEAMLYTLRVCQRSSCCDLEIEGNNNFFVMGPGSGSLVLCHNSHLITVPGRGDHLEVALMKLAEINPNIRIVFLSATLPNVDQVCGWLGDLTKKPTYLLKSQYRPCPLNIHYEMYEKVIRDYDANEDSKIWSAEQIIEHYPGDKFLVFAHTKRTGTAAKKRFQEKGIQCEFHNADLTKEKRIELETRFKTDKDFRVIIATSTLAWGLNLPARRVIILGVHRGLSLVPTYDIAQMVGRAGRPAYDPAGDAYILLPDEKRDFLNFKEHCETPTYIESQLLSHVGNEEEGIKHYKVLAFHVVSEIHRRQIRTRKDFHAWFCRSLANYQAQDLDADIIDNVIELLLGCYAIQEEDGELDVTAVGTIASMLYYSPFDVADFKRNFHQLFTKGHESNDVAVAMALGNIDSFRFGICSKAEREEMDAFSRSLTPIFGPKAFTDSAVKAGFCYHNLLQGRYNATLNGMIRGLQYDFDRTSQVLTMVDQMASKWGRHVWFQGVKTRIKYGVRPHLVGLCGLPEVGAVRSQKLYDAGFRSSADIVHDPVRAASILKFKGPRMEALLAAVARSKGSKEIVN